MARIAQDPVLVFVGEFENAAAQCARNDDPANRVLQLGAPGIPPVFHGTEKKRQPEKQLEQKSFHFNSPSTKTVQSAGVLGKEGMVK